MLRYPKRSLLAAALIFVVIATAAHAQPQAINPDRVMDSIQALYHRISLQWISTFQARGRQLFGLLFVIDLSYTGIEHLIKKGSDIGDIVAALIRQCFIFGFFYGLLQFGATWIPDIIHSFTQVAGEANQAIGAANGLSPSTIFDLGMDAGTRIIDAASIMSPTAGLIGLAIVGVSAWIAAIQLLTLCEAYLITSIGILFFGFGGSRWTREYASKIITWSVSIGVKLMLIQLIVGVGDKLVSDLATAIGTATNLGELFPFFGALIVLAMLVHSLPQTAMSIINGVSLQSGSGIGAAVGAGAAAAGAVTGVAAAAHGGTSALTQATKLAKAQMAAEGGGGSQAAGARGLGGVLNNGLQMAARTAGNLSSAMMADASRGLAGEERRGSIGHRMARDMSEQAQQLAPSSSAASAKNAAAPTPTSTFNTGQSQMNLPNQPPSSAGSSGGSSPSSAPSTTPSSQTDPKGPSISSNLQKAATPSESAPAPSPPSTSPRSPAERDEDDPPGPLDR